MNRRLLQSEFRQHKSQYIIVIACVALAILSIVSIGGFSESVRKLISADARGIAGGDIIVEANRPFSTTLEESIVSLENDPSLQIVRIADFLSIITNSDNNSSLFVSVRAATQGYPAAGVVTLQSGRSVTEALQLKSVIIDESTAARLNLSAGGTVAVGSSSFTVSDVVLFESSAQVSLFSSGRIIMRYEDLEATGLVGERSRVEYLAQIAAPQTEQSRIVSTLTAALGNREEAELAINRSSGTQRFLTNTLFFIRIISLFTLMLAGLAMTSAVRAILSQRQETIGVIKALGMTDGAVLAHYLVFVAILGVAGTSLGIILGLLVQQLLPIVFAGLLPQAVPQVVSWLAIGKGAIYGLLVTVLFSAVPLLQLKAVRPNVILRREVIAPRLDKLSIVATALLLALVTGLIALELDNLILGAYFMGGFIALIFIVWLLVRVTLYLVRKLCWTSRFLELRLATRSLLRPTGSATSIMTSLGVSLTLLFAIILLQQTIENNFVSSYPPEAPNVFILDVEPKNKTDIFANIAQFTTDEPLLFPVVRGALTAVRNAPPNPADTEEQGRDPLTRDFSLTYGMELMKNEEIITASATGGIFDDSLPEQTPQVSVMDEVATRLQIKVGDLITLRIQGFDITARVSSIRKRTSSGIEPFFYFQFNPAALADAPTTAFIAVRAPVENITLLQDSLARAYPSALTIDVSRIAKIVGDLLEKLTNVIQFFSLFSIFAGVILLLSAVLATSVERTQESVYYALIGARRQFLFNVALIEYVLVGLLASLVAALLANGVVYAVAKFALDLPFTVAIKEPLILAIITTILVVGAGLLVSRPARSTQPLKYLRENGD